MSIKKWCLKRSLRKAFKKRYYQDLSVYENSLKGCMVGRFFISGGEFLHNSSVFGYA